MSLNSAFANPPLGISKRTYTGQRKAELIINNEFLELLTPSNTKLISTHITTNFDANSDQRGLNVMLPNPITIHGRTWVQVYLKGIIFDESQPLIPHQGRGYDSRQIEVDKEGNWIFNTEFTAPNGGMKLDRAKREFKGHLKIYSDSLLRDNNIFTSAPIAYGRFPNAPLFQGQPLGFVVLGIDSNMPPRDRVTVNAWQQGVALRLLHERLYFHPYFHLSNLSSDGSRVYIHDLDTFHEAIPEKMTPRQMASAALRDVLFAYLKNGSDQALSESDYISKRGTDLEGIAEQNLTLFKSLSDKEKQNFLRGYFIRSAKLEELTRSIDFLTYLRSRAAENNLRKLSYEMIFPELASQTIAENIQNSFLRISCQGVFSKY